MYCGQVWTDGPFGIPRNDHINNSIVSQGDLVRKLKADKAAKPDIDEAVKKLLALKADFKAATGNDWKPGTTVPASAPASADNNSGKTFSLH